MGAWIETDIIAITPPNLFKSHLVWVRGLKLRDRLLKLFLTTVAPRVGAWIETRMSVVDLEGHTWSHLVWVRGLKLNKASDYTEVDGRTSCGCVD